MRCHRFIDGANQEESGMKTGKSSTAATAGAGDKTSAQLIDARIEELGDWRGATLARIRKLIHAAVPDVTETWKWRGVPVWEQAGIICTGETYKEVVKLTFAKGAAVADPAGLFNSSLEGNTRRAIDIRDGDKLDEKALKALFRAAAALNAAAAKAGKPAAKRPVKKTVTKKTAVKKTAAKRA